MSEVANRSVEFPCFKGEEWEDHVSAWSELEQREGMLQLAKGAVASSVETRYGDGSLERFASDVRTAHSTLRDYISVYRRLERLEVVPRGTILDAIGFGALSYTHIKEARVIENDAQFVRLLERTQDENWTTRRVAEEVARERGLVTPNLEQPEAIPAGPSFEDVRERLSEQGLELRVVPKEDIKTEQGPPLDEPQSNVHFMSDTDEWYTPERVVNKVVSVLGELDLDPCAEPGKGIPAKAHLTKAEDGLQYEWSGVVYMNPPYGREILPWVEKLKRHYEAGDVPAAIALLPARTDTEWFALLDGYPRCFVRGRLKFSGGKNSAPFPSAAIYLGNDKARFIQAFADLGTVFERVQS